MKRFFDIVLSVCVLTIILPIGFVVAAVVYFDLGCPIFFIQLRPGYKGKPFSVYKFRTMKEPSEDGLLGEGDADRLTKIGRFLRKTSLDEIPQLWNVLKGDMSLVGPRPLLMEYLPLYSDRQMRRHDVIPGITGWAQVNGRNRLSWQDKFELDLWYVQNQSFWLDMRILFKTVAKVLLRDGVSSSEHVTSEKFEGNNL
ncbi:sugar transferase [Desulfuromonas acetoxidans]|uniref:Undecaprenyl-phosphate galactosephosphotransferase n=1 Tax=Desulfuromonas acetoxidans (strain DSM 684 / 11070) TaxID=281689 RepID=Q1K183_DESA6|nr:sugar transferase [Desulfuromonas acetoxidans]EAT16125.1 Undecaprenyl-phosphate galactosephosphotransferase [Desulfuromonas acetoxidans DSM 684]MBF0646431.1 sugar transferase [Desulfuromonas acetoxidans]NVD25522.1 sugar transferase [Desulfuromonas acetoxidans]NVE17528.1 sugar transferase [Desulfuromonas acetoxidans]